MKKKYYLTTAISYANGSPHIGHITEAVIADVITRFRSKFLDQKVYFLTGTDEHGVKIKEAAEKAGDDYQTFVDKISKEFQIAWKQMDIDYSRFIRTTDKDHEEKVVDFYTKLKENGYIDKRIYEGLYCVGCERFYSDDELVEGLCPDHQIPPINYKEENYFFKLSSFEKRLITEIENENIKIIPETKKNEILGKLKIGLEDISVSRNLDWGIKLPFDDSQVAYVWVDALINYLTYGDAEKVWPADLHIIGKDILWFHTVIWPALLWGAGYEAPKCVYAHGFFTIAGKKISKSIGNVITPKEMVEKLGSSDAARYILLSSFSLKNDGDFSWSKMYEKYNNVLANNLGNFASRLAKLSSNAKISDVELPRADDFVIKKVSDFIESADIFSYCEYLEDLLSQLNLEFDSKSPWSKSGDEQKQILEELMQKYLKIVEMFEPLMPNKAREIITTFVNRGAVMPVEKPIFPRLENLRAS